MTEETIFAAAALRQRIETLLRNLPPLARPVSVQPRQGVLNSCYVELDSPPRNSRFLLACSISTS
jgi:hypothetical protein